MTNSIKISQLPAATTPLTGAEQTPVVQTETTKRTTVSDVASYTLGLSQLSVASTLTGAEVTPVVQSGTPKKTTVADIAAYTLGLPVQEVYDVTKPPYNAVGNGSTNDGPAIQAALTAAGAAGGGIVFLPAKIFYVNEVLSVPSNVTFTGAGRQISVLKGPVGSPPNKTINGYSTNATVATNGTTGVRISHMKIDHITNGTTSNGIQIGGTSPSTTTDYVVEDCWVEGYDSHQYCIWNLRAEKGKIRNNYINGNSTGGTQLEGIEIFGGDDIEVSGNYVTGINQVAIYAVQISGITDTGFTNIYIHDNTVVGANVGITVSADGSCARVLVVNNICTGQTGTTGAGIKIGASASSTLTDVLVAGNVMFGCQTLGIYVPLSTATCKNIRIQGNQISGLTATFTVGIGCNGGPVYVDGNLIEASYQGVSFDGGSGNVADSNIINITGTTGIGVQGSPTALLTQVTRNNITANTGVYGETLSTGYCVGNTFLYNGTEPNPAFNLASGWRRPQNNVLLYTPTVRDPLGQGNNWINGLSQTRTAAQLYSAAGIPNGTTEYVSDANATTYLSAVAGGGANSVRVTALNGVWTIA
jgi:hypothetical protein